MSNSNQESENRTTSTELRLQAAFAALQAVEESARGITDDAIVGPLLLTAQRPGTRRPSGNETTEESISTTLLTLPQHVETADDPPIHQIHDGERTPILPTFPRTRTRTTQRSEPSQSITVITTTNHQLRANLFDASTAGRRNAISHPRHRQQTREQQQAAARAARRRRELLARLEYQSVRNDCWCITDADRMREEEDKEDEDELYGMREEELSFEGQLARENGWM